MWGKAYITDEMSTIQTLTNIRLKGNQQFLTAKRYQMKIISYRARRDESSRQSTEDGE